MTKALIEQANNGYLLTIEGTATNETYVFHDIKSLNEKIFFCFEKNKDVDL